MFSRSHRVLSVHRAVAAAAVAMFASTIVLAADSTRITIGEVTARVEGADAQTEATLRGLVQREIDGLELKRCKRHETFVFSASLLKLDAKTSREGSRVSTVVSGSLRSAATGALLATMRGSAVVEDDKTVLERAKFRSLQSAVHGAVKDLPNVL
jgi:hypothetical protein